MARYETLPDTDPEDIAAMKARPGVKEALSESLKKSKAKDRYAQQPSMRLKTKEDDDRDEMMKKMGITHEDLMNEFRDRLKKMKDAKAGAQD